MEILKKNINEIIALYSLEKSLNDIYVEGVSDKVFLDNFLKNKNCNRKVVIIDIVDFKELPKDYFEDLDMTSNRNKALILSKLLNETIPTTNVRCIVDKDFEDFIRSISNPLLMLTDFSCLESYLFCEEVFEKFLAIGIGDFPFPSKFILNQLSNVLKPLFCLRLLRELYFPYAKLINFDGNLLIDRITGRINFNQTNYLDKFIMRNGLSNNKQEIVKQYEEIFQELNLGIQHHLNGHDFIEIFFLYVNKIKNTPNYRIENFYKALFLTAETPMLEKYPLFRKIACMNLN